MATHQASSPPLSDPSPSIPSPNVADLHHGAAIIPKPTTWSALFQTKTSKFKSSLEHFEPVMVDGIAEVPADVIDLDRKMALEMGSIFIGGKLFVVRPWGKEVEKDRKLMNTIPIWVKFTNVPRELWTTTCLAYMASTLGKPVCLDEFVSVISCEL
ncbi:hypothetical protein FRX31_008524 [Thalictrum thalictroides]|uniref:DUF4283 domain-containing protein n=1 Tax=Thalictrum thalictroides TaxID=46969 RepID=A0A7J6WWT3_THATH|nr:hypothetical protein FRX31_008524 [Thalictrum thalictroides]